MHGDKHLDTDEDKVPDGLFPDSIRRIAQMAGIDLSDERVLDLLPQAESHLALMRSVIGLDAFGTEPSAEFRLRDGEVREHD
jgi:hypothetical protein